MISRFTVLILGAGASIPYGYPSGKDLKIQILDNLKQQSGNRKIQELTDARFQESDILRFRKDLFYSSQPSVDAFLEHRKDLTPIGKAAIAQALIPRENTDTLFVTDDWYAHLLANLNCPSLEDFGKNKLSIITFNYDRSFEHFLLTSLIRKYGKNEKECIEQIKKIPIIHVYGQLGLLPWQDGDGWKKEYRSNYSVKTELRKTAECINIIHEGTSTSPQLVEAQKLLHQAERIYFLGFGYNTTNLQRLNIKEHKQKDIQGSAYGLKAKEIEVAIRNIGKDPGSSRVLGHSGLKVLEFLREYIYLDQP